MLPLRAVTALLDGTIRSLERSLAAETDEGLALSMRMPTSWDPYFKPTEHVRRAGT